MESQPNPPPPVLLRVAAIGLPVVVAALLLAFVLGHSFSIYDDAYIYFRYADNLRDGCGLAFNCGEPPVEGFTSPLYLVLLTLGGVLTGDVEAWSQLLGPLCLGVGLVLAVRMVLHGRCGASLPLPLALAAAAAVTLVLGLDHYVHLNAVSGLETGLGATVVVLQARAVLRRDVVWTCGWSVVGVLVRPEHGVFVLLLLPLLPWVRRRRAVLGVVAALAAMTAARWLAFGEILPNTYFAKAGGTAVHAGFGAQYLVQVAHDFPFILFAPLVLLHRDHRREHGVLLLGAGLWLLYFLRTGGDHFAYSRLAFPLVPMLVVQAALGLAAVAGRLDRRAIQVAVALVPALLVGGRAYVVHDLPPTHGFANVERWGQVGRWLAEHHPGQTIATVPVGAMAYRSGLPTIDLVGITSREVSRHGERVPETMMRRHWLGHERHHTAWVLQRAPDLIVTTKVRPQPWRQLAEAKAGFFADWLLLQQIKAGRAPYEIYSAEIAPGVHWLMFRRRG